MSNSYIGAIASMQGSTPEYYNEDFESYVADPQKADTKANLFGRECITVGIQDTFMPTDKADASNLEKAQYNIRERFSYLQDRDDD